MKKPTKCRNGVLSQSGASISPLDQLGVSNFALGERKIKNTNALCFNRSAFSAFVLYVIKVLKPSGGFFFFSFRRLI